MGQALPPVWGVRKAALKPLELWGNALPMLTSEIRDQSAPSDYAQEGQAFPGCDSSHRVFLEPSSLVWEGLGQEIGPCPFLLGKPMGWVMGTLPCAWARRHLPGPGEHLSRGVTGGTWGEGSAVEAGKGPWTGLSF